ncbi:hypothetical protein GCM10010909_07470 [Acidocella aquatica]|uniref:SnoaL-like domain-containing protein n=1 Tax=Acidocella aquatica TaxID=1922313 RepID=A0ABQ6A0V6_9PROT|nr:nuclear transport factor 2 family protein [Acidocella aquatica]GLR66069.1 hypothetical protein GCM10010909_07470 [Acidocella aquatica]
MNNAAIAIPNLLYTYAELFDAGDFPGAARLFNHGALVIGGQRIAGEEAIAELWRGWVQLYAGGSPRTRHLTTNPIITLAPDGNAASCRSQWTVLQATEAYALQIVATGRYEDKFQHMDGEWRFTERLYARVDFTGDTSAHLKKQLMDKDG